MGAARHGVLQTLGGSGFLQDYPLEQYVRDAKIDTLYEGTTAIQGLDFFFRKIVRDKGLALGHVADPDRRSSPRAAPATAGSPRERELLGQALEDVQGIVGVMVGALMPRTRAGRRRPQRLQGRAEHHAAAARRTATCVVGWLLLRQAEVASRALARGVRRTRRAFYQGKVAAARFFARQVLPRLSAERAIAEATDNDADGPRRGRLLTRSGPAPDPLLTGRRRTGDRCLARGPNSGHVRTPRRAPRRVGPPWPELRRSECRLCWSASPTSASVQQVGHLPLLAEHVVVEERETVWYQTLACCGLSTQWFSSGK